MLELLNDIFWDLMTNARWFRRIVIFSLAVILIWCGAGGAWFLGLFGVLGFFEGLDYLFRRRKRS